jgi:hypothetical protein
MPKRIKLQQNIPALMSRNVYEIMLISWVQSRKALNNNFSLTTSVRDFLKFYCIPSEYWDFHTAEQFAYNSLGDDFEMKFEMLTKKIIYYGN